MKTEKRKAKVGERILITNAKPAMGFGQYYSNGDILHVTKTDIYGEGNVGVDEFRGYIRDDEYEVVVDENETEADNVVNVNFSEMSLSELEEFVQKAVKALSKRAFHAGFRDGREAQRKLDGKRDERKKSLQQRRDAIIEKAKRDVAEILGEYDSFKMTIGRFNDQSVTAKFVVNSKKRTIVALIYGYFTKKLYYRGIAKCAPDDCFNVHIGKAIALRRALGLEVPDEYLNAPQPTEVRVGDVIYVPYLPFSSIRRVTDNPFLSIIDEIGVFTAIRYLSSYSEVRIIDDSREGCVAR